MWHISMWEMVLAQRGYSSVWHMKSSWQLVASHRPGKANRGLYIWNPKPLQLREPYVEIIHREVSVCVGIAPYVIWSGPGSICNCKGFRLLDNRIVSECYSSIWIFCMFHIFTNHNRSFELQILQLLLLWMSDLTLLYGSVTTQSHPFWLYSLSLSWKTILPPELHCKNCEIYYYDLYFENKFQRGSHISL